MISLWIHNSYAYHLEVIESIIQKYNEIIKKNQLSNVV